MAADGSALVYSTYLGGSSTDGGNGIAVDTAGSAYVTGGTFSTDFPTASPLQAAYGGGFGDAFVTKLNPTGSALTYSTYLGGSSNDYGSGIVVDTSGNTYMTGLTSSINFPTASPLQDSCDGCGSGFPDAFIMKLAANGSALVYSTYLGGSSSDYGSGIAIDSFGNTYVTGDTFSTNFPTASPLQGTCGGCGGFGDAFVAKIVEGEVSCLEQFVTAVRTCLQSENILPCVKEAFSALRECQGAAGTVTQ